MSVLAGLLFLCGAGLAVLTGVGLLRFRDAMSRVQAATKLQIAGLEVILVGAMLLADSAGEVLSLVLVAVFQLITAPLLGQVIGQAAQRSSPP